MNLIFDTLGTPEKKDMDFVTNENAVHYINGLKKKPRKNFRKLFPKANPLGMWPLDLWCSASCITMLFVS